MDSVFYFILTIGILVFVHEFGHFLAARICKMRTDVFAIGFGKRLFGWNKINGFTVGDLPKDLEMEGHTDYRISMLPLGGYVKIAGMVDESFDFWVAGGGGASTASVFCSFCEFYGSSLLHLGSNCFKLNGSNLDFAC